MCALCSITISVLATIGVLTEFCRWWRAEELCYGWEAILDRWACWEWSIEGLRWLRCFIVVVVVMAHSSKFKFYILFQGLDGVQVPVRRVLARTDYQAPTCAQWVPISLLSNSLLQLTQHQRLEGNLSPARPGVCGVLLGRSGLTRSLQTTSPFFNLQGPSTSVKRYRLREEISTSPGPSLDAQKNSQA